MKKHTLIVATALASVLLSGCQERQTYTLNPDRSGKVVYEYHAGKELRDNGRLNVLDKLLNKTNAGVEVWTDVSLEHRNGDAIFRGTALFPDINKVNVGYLDTPPLKPVWTVSEGTAVLKLRPSFSAASAAASPGPLTEEQIASEIEALRNKPVIPPFTNEEEFKKIRLEYVLHLPGEVIEQTNFTAGDDGSLSLVVTGESYIRAAKTLLTNEAELREVVLAGEKAKAKTHAKLCREMIGTEAGITAKIKLNNKPAFDYAAEVAAAKENYLDMMAKLGLYWTDIPENMPLRFKSITPSRVDGKTIRYKVKRPRKAISYNGGLIFRMVAEDGTLVLPHPGVSQKIKPFGGAGAQLIINFPENLPAGTRTLKEVLGTVWYTMADAKTFGLGFKEAAEGAKGTALDARIFSVSTEKILNGKERTKLVVGVKIPEGAMLYSTSMRWPKEANKVGREIWHGRKQLPDGYQGRTFSFDGSLDCKPTFTAVVWENFERFVVPFRLTDVPLTKEGLRELKKR